MELPPFIPFPDSDPSQEESEQEQYEDQCCVATLKPEKVDNSKINQLPHRLIGAILMEDRKRKVSLGTGVLISPDLVLTSARNVYNIDARECYKSWKFYLGQHGELSQAYQVRSHYFPDKFATKKYLRDDYALLRLQKQTNEKEFVSLKGDVQSIQAIPAEYKISTYGYISEQDANQKSSLEKRPLFQWGSAINRDIIMKLQPQKGEMRYKINTFNGQSGSPIIMDDGKGNFSIIALHRSKNFNICKARLVTQPLIQELFRTAGKLCAQYFAVPSQENIFLKGCILESQHKDQEAQHCFRQAIKKNPKNASAYSMLAVILLRLKKPKQSQEASKMALSINNNMAEAHNCMGMAFNSQGNFQEAIQCCRKAIAIDSQYADAYTSIGQALDGMGRYKEAIKWLEKAISLDKTNAMAHNNLGVAMKQLGQINKAEEQYRCSIELDPNYKFPYYNYYNLLSTLKQPKKMEEGMKFLEKVAEKNPECAIAARIHELLKQKWQKLH